MISGLMFEVENLTKSILYDLEKGNLKWEDEKVQFFLPVGLHYTNWELLRVVAENILIEEDNKVVQDFLSRVESIVEMNENGLNDAVAEKIDQLFEGL